MSVAFKEWALVCEALGDGRQSILLRKGGIAEGRAGFAFQHGEFFLFPTWFHEQLSKTTLPPGTTLPEELPDEVEIRYAAVLESTRLVTDRGRLQALRSLHILHDDVIEERFCYDEQPGVHVAIVRVFRLEPPRRLAMEKRFGGCRSWVELPDLEGVAMVSVISDEEHARRCREIEAILG
ncbi:MAG: DUF1802 family protein [Terrimicrobiaceae bacterium]|nr:DUF1802 family protein [Terrimicrobiaceae bacterium]